MSFIAFESIEQGTKDTELIKGVVIAFQEDFNDGGFKNASQHATVDWVHIAPDGVSEEEETH